MPPPMLVGGASAAEGLLASTSVLTWPWFASAVQGWESLQIVAKLQWAYCDTAARAAAELL